MLKKNLVILPMVRFVPSKSSLCLLFLAAAIVSSIIGCAGTYVIKTKFFPQPHDHEHDVENNDDKIQQFPNLHHEDEHQLNEEEKHDDFIQYEGEELYKILYYRKYDFSHSNISDYESMENSTYHDNSVYLDPDDEDYWHNFTKRILRYDQYGSGGFPLFSKIPYLKLEELLKMNVCNGKEKGSEHDEFVSEFESLIGEAPHHFYMNDSILVMNNLPQLIPLQCKVGEDFDFEKRVFFSERDFNSWHISSYIYKFPDLVNRYIQYYNSLVQRSNLEIYEKAQMYLIFWNFAMSMGLRRCLHITCNLDKCLNLTNSQLSIWGYKKLLLPPDFPKEPVH